MKNNALVTLLAPLFASYKKPMIPASDAALRKFKVMAAERNVPADVVEQLTDFYSVVDGVPGLDSLSIHKCADIIVFEWWSDGELWLGQRDFYILRWHKNKYCVGSAGTISFSPAHEFHTLAEGVGHMVGLYAQGSAG
ncbi:hypothetical protein [Nevskia soli]|uniref:hypothetical protein n=1 Tax=Nevskia soli TaxID=418856 RepID=UPI0012FB52B0|nr:hypothetical protein [Nevskia soli]